MAAKTCVSAIGNLPLSAVFCPDKAAAIVACGFFAKLLHVYSQTSSSLLDKSVTLLVPCGQDGAMDLLRELKSFNMTLRLLQVGPIGFLTFL